MLCLIRLYNRSFIRFKMEGSKKSGIARNGGIRDNPNRSNNRACLPGSCTYGKLICETIPFFCTPY